MAHDTDDSHRAKEGVVICLRDMANGSSRLIFDHVVTDGPSASERVWKHKVFSTHNTYDNNQLERMELSGQQFQEIGETVVALLLAVNKRLK